MGMRIFCKANGIALVREGLPYLFGDEGNHWMHQTQGGLQNPSEYVLCCSFLFTFCTQRHLRHLHIPVAEVVPEELIDRAACIIHIVSLKRIRYRCSSQIEPMEYPSICERELRRIRQN